MESKTGLSVVVSWSLRVIELKTFLAFIALLAFIGLKNGLEVSLRL
jgi:hypothetical protein